MVDEHFKPPPPPPVVDPESVNIIEPGRRRTPLPIYPENPIIKQTKPIIQSTNNYSSTENRQTHSDSKLGFAESPINEDKNPCENKELVSERPSCSILCTPEESEKVDISPKQPEVLEPNSTNTQFLKKEGTLSDQRPSESEKIIDPSLLIRNPPEFSDIPTHPTPTAPSLWQYHPLPSENNIPDSHPEYHSHFLEGAHSLRLIAARVRGKKHKHEGTHCDDWFEIATCGDWNLIAVSDGAGSKRFSRVGARVSCEKAIQSLQNDLSSFSITPKVWNQQSFSRNQDTYNFVDKDLYVVEDAIRKAIVAGYLAVENAVQQRLGSAKHIRCLDGREIDIKDLYATLLLIAHTYVQDVEGSRYDLAMSVAIGDGMMGSISREGKATLMMVPDSGQFSGETEFLSAKMLESKRLQSRINLLPARPQRAFMAMTDGVADDYFPNDLGLARLFGDLVLNRIVDFPEETQIADNNEEDRLLKQAYRLPSSSFNVAGERLTAKNGRQGLELNSVELYAQQLRIPLERVLANFNLLLAGRRKSPLPGQDLAEQLLTWLDAYQVRGSFDDRTLVIAYRESLP